MDARLYAAFILASVLLALFPGPNMALIVANSVQRGTRYGFLTLAGTSAALVLQLVLVSVGMTTVMATAGHWLSAIRLLGAAYLVYLGIQSWRAPPPSLEARVVPVSARATVLRGMLVSLTNPKTLLFFGAFFPQFVAPTHPLGPQLAVLSATFVVVVAGLDSIWAALAGRARHWIARQGRLVGKLSGGLLIGAGVGLALSRAR